MLLALAPLQAAEHHWQVGVCQAITRVSEGAVAAPIGTMVFAVPLTSELVTIDGPDGIRYIGRWERHLEAVIHDPLTFAVEGKKLYIQQGKKVWTLRLVSRARLSE